MPFPPPGLVNRTLRPQTARHYEAGIRHYFIPEVNAGLTLFWIDLHHEIYFNPLGSSVYTTLFGINSNYNKTRRQGLEFSFGVSIPESVLALLGKTGIPENFTIFCNYTYTKATFREGSFIGTDPFTGGLALLSYEYNDIPLVPRHKASLGFDTTIWRGINFAATVSGKLKMFLQSFAIGTVIIKMAHVQTATWGYWFTTVAFTIMLVVTVVSGLRATQRSSFKREDKSGDPAST